MGNTVGQDEGIGLGAEEEGREVGRKDMVGLDEDGIEEGVELVGRVLGAELEGCDDEGVDEGIELEGKEVGLLLLGTLLDGADEDGQLVGGGVSSNNLSM